MKRLFSVIILLLISTSIFAKWSYKDIHKRIRPCPNKVACLSKISQCQRIANAACKRINKNAILKWCSLKEPTCTTLRDCQESYRYCTGVLSLATRFELDQLLKKK